jgi:putative tryptophan/tyrosine transport system substrate-binding protein
VPLRLVGLVVVLACCLAPLIAQAQPRAIPQIGYLGPGTEAGDRRLVSAFRQGLSDLGWIENQTITIEYRWAEGRAERLPALVQDLVRAKVDVIVTSGRFGIRAAKEATTTLPILFVLLNDPVSAGFVKSLARPGGNATGLASQFEELVTKQTQLMKEALPGLSRIVLLSRVESAPSNIGEAAEAAHALGLTVSTLKVGALTEYENAFRMAQRDRAGAIQVLPSPVFNTHRRVLIDLAAKYRIPAIYEFRDYVEDGGLMSYGPSITRLFRGLAGYVDRVLKGAKPADLPVERPSTFELVINAKASKALQLTISPSVLARADEIIQ